MKNIMISLLLWGAFQGALTAQTIQWITPCTNQSFCLSQNSCSEGAVSMSVEATGGCTLLDYIHYVDIGNNGGTEITGSGSSFSNTLPIGTHKITWRVNDGCAHILTCSSIITVKDCSPPNLLCINGLTQSLDGPICEETFSANQFILNVSDNCTPTNQINIGIRKFGTGTGFPTGTSVTYQECDAGTNFVEIWARDANGFVNSCQSYVLVQNPPNSGCSCNPDGDITLKGCVRKGNNAKTDHYILKTQVMSTGGVASPVVKNIQKNTTDSCYASTVGGLPFGGNYAISISAERNDAQLNGVSTNDLLLISKHILGIQTFSSVYQLAAADVNASGTVTSFDIVETRKLLLGIYDTFPMVKSWRFAKPINGSSNLDNWGNLSYAAYNFNLNNLQDDTTVNNLVFVAIKSGDVNYNSMLEGEADDRSALLLTTENRTVTTGNEYILPIKIQEDMVIEGLQLAIRFDPEYFEVLSVGSDKLKGLGSDQYSVDENGVLRIVWTNTTACFLKKGDVMVNVQLVARQTCDIAEKVNIEMSPLAPEIYLLDGHKRKVVFGSIDAGNLIETGNLFFAPQPNPFKDKTLLRISLKNSGMVSFSIMDLMGRVVRQSNQWMEPGYHSLEITANDLPTEGVYVYRFKVGQDVFTGKIMVE